MSIELTEAEWNTLANAGMQMPSVFPEGTIGHAHCMGVLAAVERIVAARVAGAKVEAWGKTCATLSGRYMDATQRELVQASWTVGWLTDQEAECPWRYLDGDKS